MNACRVCRPIPKGLRDWLLKVFVAGDTADPIWPVAVAYAQWGAARVVRGEQPYPLEAHRPGDIDPFDALRAWFPMAVRDLLARQKGEWPDGGARGSLDLTPENKRKLAGRFQVSERAVYRAIERAEALLRDYGHEVGQAVLVHTIEKEDIPNLKYRYSILLLKPDGIYWSATIQRACHNSSEF